MVNIDNFFETINPIKNYENHRGSKDCVVLYTMQEAFSGKTWKFD